MNSLIFGAITGIALAFSGMSINDQPIKTIGIGLALIVAHEITKGKS